MAHNEKIIITCVMLASMSSIGISDGLLNGSIVGGAANQIIFGSIIKANSITADKLKVNL